MSNAFNNNCVLKDLAVFTTLFFSHSAGVQGAYSQVSCFEGSLSFVVRITKINWVRLYQFWAREIFYRTLENVT